VRKKKKFFLRSSSLVGFFHLYRIERRETGIFICVNTEKEVGKKQ
jgi:hypothetical protein